MRKSALSLTRTLLVAVVAVAGVGAPHAEAPAEDSAVDLVAQGPKLVELVGELDPLVQALTSPHWNEWDIEGFEGYYAWIEKGEVDEKPTVGDGLPDALQVALLAAVLEAAGEESAPGLFSSVRAKYEQNLALLEGELDWLAANRPGGGHEKLREVKEILAGLMGVSQPMQDTYKAMFTWPGTLGLGTYVLMTGWDSTDNKALSPQGDLDADGDTNIEEWEAADGDAVAFLKAAQDPWQADSLPAAGPLGLALCACITAVVAAARGRRA